MKRSRKRWLAGGGLVIIGAIMNVTVAWGLVLRAGWLDAWAAPFFASLKDVGGWFWPATAPGEAPNAKMVSRALGADAIEVSLMRPISADSGIATTEVTQRTLRAGWPMRSLETRDSYPGRQLWKPWFISQGIWINSWEQGLGIAGPKSQGQIVLPLVPRPVGFALNTALYASLGAAACFLPARARRWRRRRRGRCQWCNYDLEQLTTCPECGRSST